MIQKKFDKHYCIKMFTFMDFESSVCNGNVISISCIQFRKALKSIEFSYISQFSAKSWQDSASIDI